MQKIEKFDGMTVEIADGVVQISQRVNYTTNVVTFPIEIWGWIRGAVETEISVSNMASAAGEVCREAY